MQVKCRQADHVCREFDSSRELMQLNPEELICFATIDNTSNWADSAEILAATARSLLFCQNVIEGET